MQFNCKTIHFIQCLKFSPVPELMSREEGAGLKGIEFEEDLQKVKSQEPPLCVGYQRVPLIQTDEYGIYQDDQVISVNKHPVWKKHIRSACMRTCSHK